MSIAVHFSKWIISNNKLLSNLPNHTMKVFLFSLINSRTLKYRKEWKEPQEHERLQVKHDINGVLEP